ncbi:MAG: response regulator, partial [Chloroflexi bacterium]|nr:response regulator [Chloroflexota bacterium]
AQLMQRREQYSERAVEAILGQTRQLERLIDDLLDITRASTGRLELQFADTDLLALAQNAVDEAQAPTSLHRVRLRAPHRPIRGAWDADRLGQVFRNLLSNAIKYSPAGGEIVVRVRPEATAATITVIDQGQGIPEEALPRLFDRFYRVAHGAGQASGLGLGLAITKTRVEAHGGRIEVASTLGQGSTFTVHLPYDGVGEPGAPPPAAGQPTPRVLIVDDDEQIRTLLEQALLDEGYEVATAADGQEALCRVQTEPPHLILLDLIMPTLDGLEFAQQLDRQRLRGETPILIISAGDRLSQSAAQIRAAAHLAKPFDLTMLLEMVGRLMPHLAQ